MNYFPDFFVGISEWVFAVFFLAVFFDESEFLAGIVAKC
jgi:hypothetical protein